MTGTLAVALKWVDTRPDVDRLTGSVRTDPRNSEASEADRAALEWALRLAGSWGWSTLAVTVGPPGSDAVLRVALAAGADDAVRVDGPSGLPSPEVASALAGVLRGRGAELCLCGDWSADRGSGSVPPLLAGRLGWAQACGAVAITDEGPGRLLVERRLDAGRRERARVNAPAVVSVEGSTARLRREPLPGVLAATARHPTVVGGTGSSPAPARHVPYRPRARVLPGPDPSLSARERILALTGSLVERTPPQQLVLEPEEAARRILEQLRAWGVGPAAGDTASGEAVPGDRSEVR